MHIRERTLALFTLLLILATGAILASNATAAPYDPQGDVADGQTVQALPADTSITVPGGGPQSVGQPSFNDWCANNGFEGGQTFQTGPHDAKSWRCVNTYPVNMDWVYWPYIAYFDVINPDQVCQEQFGNNDLVARYAHLSDGNSWYCFSSATAPGYGWAD